MSYEPQPGTYAYRVLAHLQANAGTDFTMSVLADVMGERCTPQNLKDCIEPLLRHGLVERFTKHGLTRPAFYRLAPGSQKTPPRDRPMMGSPPPSHSEVLALARNGHLARFPMPDGVDIDRANRVAESVPNGAETLDAPQGSEAAHLPVATKRQGNGHAEGRPDPAGHFRCARWGDGSLTIETDEQTLQFTPDQARQIRALWEVAA